MRSKRGSSTERARARVHWRPVSSGRALASAMVAALGVLTPIYLATDTGLSGPRFLLAILLATGAVLLIVEAISRARLERRWHSLVALGVLAEVASLLIVLVPSSHGGAVSRHRGLRLGLRQTAPELFAVAFSKPIPWPSAREGWSDLHRRGGIDVHDSHFRLILANESPAPISVLSVNAEVVGSKPLPHGTYAWRYSQGDEGVGKLVTLLPNGRRGSVAKTYPGADQVIDPETLSTKTPFFETKYILLQPGEVYPATLTVQAEISKTIRYRLTAEGESANRHFVVRSPTYQIVGRFEDPEQLLFARYYSKGHDPYACTPTPKNPWVDAHLTDRFSVCPHGLSPSRG
jgi:hypothetical protein